MLPKDEQIVIGLKDISYLEMERFQEGLSIIYSDFAANEVPGKKNKLELELVEDKFIFAKGLEAEGYEGDLDFKKFCEIAPAELQAWVRVAVMSTSKLMEAERKNFLPGSPSV